jgi:hypothetical protein
MSSAIFFHTSLDVKELEKRLKQIEAKHPELFEIYFQIDPPLASDREMKEIILEEGFDFDSVSFFMADLRNEHDVAEQDGVDILKREFSDVEFIALFQNETIM